MKFIQNNLTAILVITIIILVIARIAILPYTPPLFWLDESAGSAHVANMVLHGTNAFGQSWPLYSEALGGGYTTPVYLYPAVIWSFLFGFSPVSLRYFSEFSTLAAIAVLAYSLRSWTDKRTALIATCVALALPWGWLQGSIAWDPALVPLCVSLAFLAFTKLLYAKSQLTRIVMYILLPVSLLLLAYLYPPLRVSAPLLFIGAYAVLYKKSKANLKQITVTCVGSFIFALPLLHFMQDPDSLSRSQNLIVFSIWPIPQAIGAFFVNMLQLVSPWFLFITGDLNPRHSTGFQGMLGWAEIPAFIAFIAMAIKSRLKKSDDLLLIWVGIIGTLVSLAGSALTYEGQPQSLRATAAWPFIVILLALGWKWIFRQRNKRLVMASLAVFVVATTAYALHLTFVYPVQSADAFNHDIYQKAIRHEPTPGYPDLSLKYYQSL